MRTIKLFEINGSYLHMERVINGWLKKTKHRFISASCVSMHGSRPDLIMLVVSKVNKKKREVIPALTLDETPVSISLGIPTVSAKDKSGKKVECMAGVFGVPIGWKMEGDDQPAPAPLIAPGFDLRGLAGLFSGIPKGEEVFSGLEVPFRDSTGRRRG